MSSRAGESLPSESVPSYLHCSSLDFVWGSTSPAAVIHVPEHFVVHGNYFAGRAGGQKRHYPPAVHKHLARSWQISRRSTGRGGVSPSTAHPDDCALSHPGSAALSRYRCGVRAITASGDRRHWWAFSLRHFHPDICASCLSDHLRI